MTSTDTEAALLAEFERATSLRDRGEFESALRVLTDLAAKLQPEQTRLRVHTLMQLGNVYGRLGRIDDSAAAFRAAVEVSPRRELASLGLFHALVALGRHRDAYEEMLRLLRLRDSELYRELLVDGFEDGVDVADRPLIAAARALLEEHERN